MEDGIVQPLGNGLNKEAQEQHRFEACESDFFTCIVRLREARLIYCDYGFYSRRCPFAGTKNSARKDGRGSGRVSRDIMVRANGASMPLKHHPYGHEVFPSEEMHGVMPANMVIECHLTLLRLSQEPCPVSLV